MISTFSHVLSLLLLWVSEDVVLDELMKRLFCFLLDGDVSGCPLD